MKTKGEIVETLMGYLDSVYCDSCDAKDNGHKCDECHRKAMNWGISEDYAKIIADDILS